MEERSKAGSIVSAGLQARAGVVENVRVAGVFHAVCRGPDGVIKWEDDAPNLVTTAGKNELLDAAIKTGQAAPTYYLGLVTGPGVAGANVADTMGSHAGWTENTSYDEATRVAFVPGAIASGSVANTASPAVFTLSASVTIGGSFLTDGSAKGGTTGVLYSVGAFSNGDKTGADNDTITVTYTATIT